MNTNMKTIEDKIVAHIEQDTELFSNTEYYVTSNLRKAEKFAMASTTTVIQVKADKDGNPYDDTVYISITLYIMEKLSGIEVLFVNDETHDIIYTSYGFDEKPANFDESKRPFVPITVAVTDRLCSYIDTTMKWAKKYPKDDTRNGGKRPFNKRNGKKTR